MWLLGLTDTRSNTKIPLENLGLFVIQRCNTTSISVVTEVEIGPHITESISVRDLILDDILDEGGVRSHRVGTGGRSVTDLELRRKDQGCIRSILVNRATNLEKTSGRRRWPWRRPLWIFPLGRRWARATRDVLQNMKMWSVWQKNKCNITGKKP